MNGSMDTTGAVTIDTGDGMVMGVPSRITTTNDAITVTSAANDILLGLLDAGSASVSVTATGGDILNNNGVFADVTKSLANVRAANVTLDATDRIGASSTDAITLDINASGVIDLTFGADTAFINNLQNTLIRNNTTNQVAVGLIFSGQIIGIGHSIGSSSSITLNEIDQVVYEDILSDHPFINILGADFQVYMDEEEEDEIISSIVPSVPVLIKNIDGWEFVAPSRSQNLEKIRENQRKGIRFIDWL
jgi:hypothetical protein